MQKPCTRLRLELLYRCNPSSLDLDPRSVNLVHGGADHGGVELWIVRPGCRLGLEVQVSEKHETTYQSRSSR